jgi:hypothetical protein
LRRKKELRDPVPSPHQVTAQVLAAAHQVAHPLMLQGRDGDELQVAGREQARQPQSIAPVGLTRSPGRRGMCPGAQTATSSQCSRARRASP